jgi:hypothetical protein
MSPEEAKERAEQAKHLLNHPLLKECFHNAETALNQAVRSAKTPEEAFKASLACQVFELLRREIQAHLETEKVIAFNTRPSIVDRVLRR